MFSNGYLSGKRILVTGASSGIGRQVALVLSACGAKICVTGRDLERLHSVEKELHGEGHSVLCLDLNGSDAVTDAIRNDAEVSGAFWGVFHGAGISMVRPAKLCKEKQFHDVFSSSVQSAMAIARAVSLRGVIEDGGALVLMSSVASLRGQAGMALYSAAKSAIDGMTRSLAVEFAPRRIRVNSLCAGAVHTPMHEKLVSSLSAESVKEYEDKHLLGFGVPDDVANTVAFLIGEGGRWITGTSIVVDGGYTVR